MLCSSGYQYPWPGVKPSLQNGESLLCRRPSRGWKLSYLGRVVWTEGTLDILTAHPKIMYRSILSQTSTQSTAFKRWSEAVRSPLQITDIEDWRDTNLSVYRAVREMKLHSLHFKIMNRVVPCNKFLKQLRIKASDICDLCGHEDYMIRFFLESPSVQA